MKSINLCWKCKSPHLYTPKHVGSVRMRTSNFYLVCARNRYDFQSFLNLFSINHNNAKFVNSPRQLLGVHQGATVFCVNDYERHHDYDSIYKMILSRQLIIVKVDNMGMRTITEERLKELEAAEKKLSALEANGVDNWEWYSEAMRGLSDYDD